MQTTILYLKKLFGNKIQIHDFSKSTHLPLYLTQKFDFKEASIDKQHTKYILVKPKEKTALNIETLQKQAAQIQKHTNCIPIWIFSAMRTPQRNALIQHSIPFIVPEIQLFLPNVLLDLREKEAFEKDYASTFSPATQVVFIYILLNRIQETNAHQLATHIPYSVATLNRALAELTVRELLKTEGSNTRKRYRTIQTKEYWEKGKQFLTNPVAKTFYMRAAPRPLGFYCSNAYALERLSWSLNETAIAHYAASAKTIRQLEKSQFLNEYDIFDCDYVTVEQFKYDPAILSASSYIDVISLYAQFKDNYDERIQIELDALLEVILC